MPPLHLFEPHEKPKLGLGGVRALISESDPNVGGWSFEWGIEEVPAQITHRNLPRGAVKEVGFAYIPPEMGLMQNAWPAWGSSVQDSLQSGSI